MPGHCVSLESDTCIEAKLTSAVLGGQKISGADIRDQNGLWAT